MQKLMLLILFFQMMIIVTFFIIANKKAINYDKLLKEKFPERYENEQKIKSITDIILPQKVLDFFFLEDEDKELNNIRFQSKLCALVAILSLFGFGITFLIASFIFF
ncbi:MAG TPA: hypothetical protein PK624_13410 [Spirochaetota bacterium]|nr:hypothetical protein [Spirochaetota bacterium]HOR45785.1 hypothetical protein [Spirochaetota bacterium]HOU83939.1 hypothetical protein [Spirochaetota bacterium]HPK57445.1 hypothetical protein [Spirochaetota bacterium]HQE58294.1 hypothetical protein [Spirochaetota bacterium]